MAQEQRLAPAATRSQVLVGRERELAQVVRAFGATPCVVVVSGEAGVGKSRLVTEALARADVADVLVTSCLPVDTGRPLAPLATLLESLSAAVLPPARLSPVAGALRRLAPGLPLPPEPEPLGDAAAERHRLFRALAEVLAVAPPQAVVVEDLQWADPATRDFLAFLPSHLPPRTALVVTQRGDPGASGPVLPGTDGAQVPKVRVSLDRLDARAVAELVAALLGASDVSEEFAAYLHERTGGLPLAVEELVRSLQEREDVVLLRGRWARRAVDALPVPSAVRDTVLERVGRLSTQERAIVEAAAVLQRSAAEDLLHRLSGLPAAVFLGALAHVLRAALLHEVAPARYRFSHVLARDAVYESLSPARRRQLHAAAAEMLASLPGVAAAELAEHERRAGHREWVEHAERAADEAARLHDDATAFRHLLVVADEAELATRDAVRVGLKLAEAGLNALEHEAAVRVLTALADRGDLAGAELARVRLWLGLLLAQCGDADGAVRHIAAVPEQVQDAALAAQAMMNLAVPWVVEGHVDEHLRWLRRAEALLEDVADPVVRCQLEADRAAVLLYAGHDAGWDVMVRLPRQGSVPVRRQVLRGLLNCAQAAFHLGHYRRADELLQRCAAMTAEVPYTRLEAGIGVVRLMVDWALGHWEGIEDRAGELVDQLRDVPTAAVDAEVVAALVGATRRSASSTADRLAAAVDVALSCGSVPVAALAAAGVAQLRVSAGDADQAVRATRRVLEVVRGKGMWAWAAPALPVTVQALTALGRADEADGLVAEARAALAGLDAPAAAAAVRVAGSHLASGREADTLLAEAADAWLRMGCPEQVARVSELRVSHVSLEEKGVLFTAALERYEALGATQEVARLRRDMRAAGFAPPRRGGRKGYGSQLSPRQREVARLAGVGRTNAEIADALVLSPRTVEHHVAAAMRKLGAQSRRELSRLLEADR